MNTNKQARVGGSGNPWARAECD